MFVIHDQVNVIITKIINICHKLSNKNKDN